MNVLCPDSQAKNASLHEEMCQAKILERPKKKERMAALSRSDRGLLRQSAIQTRLRFYSDNPQTTGRSAN